MTSAALGIETRRRILQAIRTLSREQRRPPTIRQIATAIGSNSTGQISYHLSALRAQGIVEPSDGRAGILLTEPQS